MHSTPPSGAAGVLLRLVLSGVALLAATAGGAILLAVAENGNAALQTLMVDVAAPAAAIVIVLAVSGRLSGNQPLSRAIALGLGFGAVATVGLELVRNIGFYAFDSMPGQLPELMGVLMTGRIMQGPDVVSNLLGWTDHFWNGALFGVIYLVLVGGFPRRRPHWTGASIGVVYGLLLGTGFLASPVSRATGAGLFGSIIGQKYTITVYLAHALFGAILGWLAHRFASDADPLWTVALRLLPGTASRTSTPHADLPAASHVKVQRSVGDHR